MSLTCQKCGGPMPELDEELVRLARSAGGVTLVHAPGGCIGDPTPEPEGRYFELRAQIVEVTKVVETDGDTGLSDSHVRTEEMLRFTVGHRADDLEAAMRPLANAFGEKYLEAEKHARLADAGVDL